MNRKKKDSPMAQTTCLASFGPVSHRLVVGADASAAGDVG